MKRRWIKLSIAGLFILLITAMLNFPASLALGWVKHKSALPIEWQQISGSIFNATVFGLSVRTEQDRFIYLDRISILTCKLSLLSGNISTEFDILRNDSWISGNGAISLGDWKLSAVSGEVLLSDLMQIFPELELFGISGELKLENINLSGDVNQLPKSGNFIFEISNLTSEMFNSSKPIGSYRLSNYEIDENHIIASMVNIAGDNQVFINAKINFSKSDLKLRVDGFSWLSENADPSLNEFLLLMGKFENNRVLINSEWQLDI